jgi:putative addiction module killer protein
MITIREYIDPEGHSFYARWFNRLNAPAAAKVATALVRIEQGNFSTTKGIGAGILECRIDFGPGYRIYFGRDGDTLVILLCGGTKKRQQKDIETAKKLWKEYKRRKRQER